MKKKIFIVACLVLVLACALVAPFAFASADYEDVVNGNGVVNFNQLCNIVGTYTVQKSSGTENGYDFGTLSNITGITWDSTHHYYVKCYFTSSKVSYIRLFFNGWGVGYNFESGDSMILTGITGSNIARCYGHFDSNFTDFFAVNIIDLDVMFGSSNIPTLLQAQELFVADYYNYTLGTPLSFDNVNAFAQAVEVVLGSLDSVMDTTTIINNAQSYLGSYKDSFIVYYSMTGNYPETKFTDVFVFYNACFVPFLTTLEGGSSIHLYSPAVSDKNLDDIQLGIYVQCADSNLILIDTLQTDSITSLDLYYTLPRDCVGIVIQNLGSTNNYIYFNSFEIGYRSNNLTSLLANSYAEGQRSIENKYKEGTNAYNEIYQAGWQAGHNAPQYDFKYLITAVVDTPVQAFTNLFDFDILGVNMKTFYLSIFTCCVIFVIIKMVI